MEGLLEVGLTNAVVAAALGVLVAGFGRLVRRPALVHALWLVVLLKLVTPPVVRVPVDGFLQVGVDTSPAPFSVPAAGRVGTARRSLGVDPLVGEAHPTKFPESEVLKAAEVETLVPPPMPRETARQPAPTALRIDLMLLLAVSWIAGSALTFLLVVVRVVRFRRLLRLCRPAPAGLEQEVARLAERLGLRRCPRVGLMPGRVSPLVWSVGRWTRLLLPEALLERLSEESRSALLLHELAHVRRRDHWVRWFELLVTALYWWHPLVWLCRRELRQAEEGCCDAWVVWALPEGRGAYARALVQTIEFLSESRTPVPAIATGIGRVPTLKRRLTMIMQGKTKRSIGFVGLLTIVFVAGATLPMLPTWGQSETEEAAQAESKQGQPKAPAQQPDGKSDKVPPTVAEPATQPAPPRNPKTPAVRSRPPEAEYLPRPTAREQRIEEALEEPTTLEFEEESLADVFQYLQDLHEIRMHIDLRELEDFGIFPSEEAVTINVTGVPLRSGLRLLLEPLELDYIIQNESLIITSEQKAEQTLITRVYPIGDFWTEPNGAEELIEAIENTIALDSWDPVGLGTMRAVSTVRGLVIRQTYRVHNQTLDFLRALREARRARGEADAIDRDFAPQPQPAPAAGVKRELLQIDPKIAHPDHEFAQRTYEAVLRGYRADRVKGSEGIEQLYLWSRRLMESDEKGGREVRLAAREAHLLRMQQLEKTVEAKYEGGTEGGSAAELWSTRYFRAEAEALLNVAQQEAAQDAKRIAPDAERAAGRIAYVSSRLGLVWIDRGNDDGISAGQRFSVYSKSIPGGKGEKKAEIEVTAIRRPHLSEARILQQDAAGKSPVLEGDLVFPSQDIPVNTLPFAVAGLIDFDGDGKSDRQVVRDVIHNAGGVIVAELLDSGEIKTRRDGIDINTKYLILGDRPDVNAAQAQAGSGAASLKAFEGMSRMIEQARNAGVEIISVDEFLEQVGERPTQRLRKPNAG